MNMKKRQAERMLYKMCELYSKGSKNKAYFYSKLLRVLCSCDIPPSVLISESTQLVHNGLGCVFHPNTVVKSGCKIYQNVTLGGNGKIIKGEKINQGAPTLEENVAVFAGACVLGPITIGHDSIIGANSVITKDVPPNSLVFGNPAIVKERTLDYNFE